MVPSGPRLFCGRAEAGFAGLPFLLLRDAFAARFEIQESDSMDVAREKFERGFLELQVGPGPQSNGREEAASRAHFIGQMLGFDFSANPSVAGLLNDPQQIRQRAFQGISNLFSSNPTAPGERAGVDTEKPPGATLLVLEDLHWTDDDTLELIAHLAQTCRRVPFMVLFLLRPAPVQLQPPGVEGKTDFVRLGLMSV